MNLKIVQQQAYYISLYRRLTTNSIIKFTLLLIIIGCTSCRKKLDIAKFNIENSQSVQSLQASLDTMTLAYKPVLVCGKIMGYKHGTSPENLEIYIDDAVKSDQVFYYNKVDVDGAFEVKIELAHPQDLMIKYQRVFSLFAAPGDTVHVEFDGNSKIRSHIYKTIKFSGDHAETNTQLATYWEKYYRKRDLKGLRKAQKKFDFIDFDDYLNQLYTEQQNLRASILNDMTANDTTILFTQMDIQLDFHKRYSEYYMRERRTIDNSGKIKGIIAEMPKWGKSSLINSKLNHLANDIQFLIPITTEKVVEDHFDHMIRAHAKCQTDQPLLKEIIFNGIVSQALKRYNELSDYLNIVSPHIQNPLIAEQLNRKLEKVIQHNQNPDISNEIHLDQIMDMDKSNIISTLIQNHKGKVLYIDFWGTYCAPCISEMMISNDIHDYYSSESVAFIYLCLDGEKRMKKWDSIVNGKGLKGHHVKLNDEQSNNLMKGIGFTGVPFYMIINKEGKLIEQGSHLRPSSGKSKILIDNLIEA